MTTAELLAYPAFRHPLFCINYPYLCVARRTWPTSNYAGSNALIDFFGLAFAPLFNAGTTGVMVMMTLGLALMGLTYGPLGTVVSELFPTSVCYTGSSLAFNMGGIFGASPAPYVATWLARTYGLRYVVLPHNFRHRHKTKDMDLTVSRD